jgi:hypothetical protein
MTLPFVGTVGDLSSFFALLAYIVYFGVAFEGCYYLAFLIREKPR